MAVGRHRADSEDGQRHDDGPRAAVPRPAAGNRDGDGTAPGAGAQKEAASTPADGGAQLRPRRSPSRGTRSAAIKHKPASPKSVRRNHDLLGWGLFLTLTSAAAMMWAGIDWPVTAVCGFLLLLSFAAVWYVSSTPPAASAEAAAPAPAPAPVKETAAKAPAKEAAPAKAPEPVAVPAAAAPASSQASSAETPLTRKQMRAADPTTGVMPVVSVFARKPSPANGTSPVRAGSSPAPSPASSPAEPAVPTAPAGQLLQGIDTGAAAADSRRARRAAAAAAAATKKKNSGKATPDSGAGSHSVAGTSKDALAGAPAGGDADTTAKVDPAGAGSADDVTDATATADSSPADSSTADASTAENGEGESRWTRVFGPPETGQLPVQRYIAAASAVDASSGSAERQQRSHSSL